MGGETFYICYNLYAMSFPKNRDGKVFEQDHTHDPVRRVGEICGSCIERNAKVMNDSQSR